MAGKAWLVRERFVTARSGAAGSAVQVWTGQGKAWNCRKGGAGCCGALRIPEERGGAWQARQVESGNGKAW